MLLLVNSSFFTYFSLKSFSLIAIVFLKPYSSSYSFL
uniref:Uncharacterized protein n=1 Tax=Siphoviridae sp. ctnot10 TaxID=2826458 RepID=A0A8S5NCR2_9CAUD|nr:MAG TPA: hypothetical protein [Siphoviridae sp. ctnot10]DAX74020.1 MAG TPA: hypothetical protein [Caudoviricetes sp.]